MLSELPYVSDSTVINVVAVYGEHRCSYRGRPIKAMAAATTWAQAPIHRQRRGGAATPRNIKDTTNPCLTRSSYDLFHVT